MSDHDQPVAANLLDRQFTAAAPNQRWVGDTSEFLVGGSAKIYVAAILDLFSRKKSAWGDEGEPHAASDRPASAGFPRVRAGMRGDGLLGRIRAI